MIESPRVVASPIYALAPIRRLIGRGRRKRKNGRRFLSAAVSNRPGKLQRAHVSPLRTFLQVDSWIYYILLFSPCIPELPRALCPSHGEYFRRNRNAYIHEVECR